MSIVLLVLTRKLNWKLSKSLRSPPEKEKEEKVFFYFFACPLIPPDIRALRGKGGIKNNGVLSQLNALYLRGNERTKGIYNHLMSQRSPEPVII